MVKHDDAIAGEIGGSRNGAETSEDRLVRTFNELKDELISTLVYVLGNREDASTVVSMQIGSVSSTMNANRSAGYSRSSGR